MGLNICSLNSGSNGNSYYIENEKEAILVDIGLSCRELERRLERLQLDTKKIKAIFISHEHSDHIKGLAVFAKKYSLPVYISAETLKKSKVIISNSQVVELAHLKDFLIGELKVSAFSKLHDAIDPYSFMITYRDVKVGVFTDIGDCCPSLIHFFSQCNAAFLECNYDDQLLEEGYYPYHLKQRIRGGRGHLSNKKALDLFMSHRAEHLSHLFLSHLSQHNNHPDLVLNLFKTASNGVEIVLASRESETALYKIG